MRSVFLSIPLLLAACSAFAQAMPNSRNLSCAAASALVRQQGGVVIATGPNLFDRYVSSQRYCDIDQTTVPAWIPTADQPQCFVGYHCRERLIHGH